MLRFDHLRAVAQHRRVRQWAGVVLLALLAATAPATAQTVTIAGEDDWAPYSSVPRGGSTPVGLAVDIVREAFAAQGVTVVFVGVPFPRCMFLAKTGQVDGCFNATLVADLRDDYHWHPTPMFVEELAIFGRKDSGRTDMTLAALEGHRVGYTIGYTYPLAFRQNPRILKAAAKSDRQLLEMLDARRVDYILINTAPAWLRLADMPEVRKRVERVGVISQDGFWVAFSRVLPEGERRAAQFEQGLAALRASGRLQAMQVELHRRLGY
ncbi:MAG: transporter [Burkholderiales bacterium PBB5]|nr:MAG: transporter [Burkholderiales bacterium PBB5]